MLWYLPIEPYKERYTGQLDAWMRTELDRLKIEYTAIIPECPLPPTIKTGQVLDANSRVLWATSQVQMLVHSIASGAVEYDDSILLMDLWHPGLDGLFYALHQYGMSRLRVSAFCWAQSVDKHDFTHPMRRWMRPVEQGYGNRFNHIFVADDGLKELLDVAEVGGGNKVRTVGLPFSQQAVWERLVSPGYSMEDFYEGKENQVVYSSRFDKEKDPLFFIEVARAFTARHPELNAKFIMCTSADEVRSNEKYIVEEIQQAARDKVIVLQTGLKKERYYHTLLESKVQFNCAQQDWVSFTLLEAVTFGCFPIYPMRRSFPNALRHEPAFLYRPDDLDDACDRLLFALSRDNRHWHTPESIELRQKMLLTEHNNAIHEMLWEMDVTGEDELPMSTANDTRKAIAEWRKWKTTSGR